MHHFVVVLMNIQKVAWDIHRDVKKQLETDLDTNDTGIYAEISGSSISDYQLLVWCYYLLLLFFKQPAGDVLAHFKMEIIYSLAA